MKEGALQFEALFDPDFLARLAPLSLRLARASKGGRMADQRTNARGHGNDFADFKPYVAGDDLRAIDWNIYRRLARPFVRVFEERQDMPVHILLDVSRSMYLETPPRAHAALRTTLALAAVALGQNDSVGIHPFAQDMIVGQRSSSGRGNVIQIARQLASLGALPGRTALAASAQKLAAMKLRRGLAIIVSDFFDEAGLDITLSSLAKLPHRLLLVQMIRASDADPSLEPDMWGDLAIQDGESYAAVEVAITPQLLERYRSAYRAFNDSLASFVAERCAKLIRMDAGKDVIDQLSSHSDNGTLVL